MLRNTRSQSLLGVFCLVFFLVLPTLGAKFNAKDFFLYVDKSCDKLEEVVNEAGDGMNALVEAALNSFNWTPLSEKTFIAYWGTITENMAQNSGIVRFDYEKLGAAMEKKRYSLYCDGSAFSYVTTNPEGVEKGKHWDDGKGRWYIAADRREPNLENFIIKGEKRPDFCTSNDGKKMVAGASVPGQPFIVLCPAAFTTGGRVKYTSLSNVKDKKQPDKTNLDAMVSTSAVMIHEFSHAVLCTNFFPSQTELYGQLFCRLGAKKQPSRVRKNADTFSTYATAAYLSQNAWVTGLAEDKTAYNMQKSGQSSGHKPPGRRRNFK